jgi:hypothetical protein
MSPSTARLFPCGSVSGQRPGTHRSATRPAPRRRAHTKEAPVGRARRLEAQESPSPFITETATKIFTSMPEALKYVEQNACFGEKKMLDD